LQKQSQVEGPKGTLVIWDLLKSIFSIFDCVDFLSPIVFQAKVFMQDIWRHKFYWDENKLSQDLIDRWIRWAKTLP
jgi:hypothetical protein